MLDEMMPPAIADRLVDAGHDVIAVKATADLIGQSDEDLLIEATRQGRILVTLDLGDFAVIDLAWKAAGRSHAGLLYISTARFALNSGFVGAVVRSLAAAADTGKLPVPDAASFLTRA
jgi:hypothetical protein